jgi:TPR repeat protein
MKKPIRILTAIFVTLVLGGMFAYQDIKRNEPPYQAHPAVVILTDFFGASLSGFILYFGIGWVAKRRERKLKQVVDDKFYEEVARELQEKEPAAGLWTKAYAEMGGDEAKTRALYIKYRVAQLAEASRQQEKPKRARNIKVFFGAAAILAVIMVIAFETATDSGDVSSDSPAERQFTYGLIDYNAKEYAKAFKRFRELSEQNNAEAQEMLGECYQYGNGVAKDEVEAVKWYQKAAEQGNDIAQCSLGECYELGSGVQKDDVEAYRWYSLAAAKGDKFAKKYLTDIADRMTPEQIAEGQKLAKEFVPKKVK